jgi:hypothetical protein
VNRIRSVVTVVALSAAALTAPAAPAGAAPGDSMADLQAALAGCSGPYAVALTQDLSDPTAVLTIGCDVTLDLAGHDLTVLSVDIGSGRTFELTDSTSGALAGTLTADASQTGRSGPPYDGLAGVHTNGPLITSGYAHLVAAGGANAAGVGGAHSGGTQNGGGVTARDHSTIRGSGGSWGSGIGGGYDGNGGSVHAEDFAQVTGIARDHAGGIGAGYQVSSNAGEVVADDDSVVSGYGIEGGAGIGNALGTSAGAGPLVIANDRSTVIGEGGGGGAGIGAGSSNRSEGTGVITVNDEATLIACGSSGGSAVGPSNGSADPTGTFLTVNGGTVRLQSDLDVPDTGGTPAVVLNGGRIVRDDGTTAGITGTGTVQNDGALGVPTSAITVAGVTRRHTTVTFDPANGEPGPAPVTVFADTFAHGDRSLPPEPSRAGYVFAGWVGPGGVPITAGSDLVTFGPSTDGSAVTVAAHAEWAVPPFPSTVLTSTPTLTNTTSPARGTAAPAVGDTLTATPGATSPDNASFAYAWQRTRGGTTSAIAGATGATYALTSDDLGARISVVATASAPAYTPASATSAPTGAVQRGTLAMARPALTNTASGARGTTAPAVGDVLASSGPSTTPAGASVALAWQRTTDGTTTPIAGATGTTYRLTPDDLGATVSVIATATRPGYTDATAASPATGPVAAGALTGVPRVTVTGRARAGHQLTATYDAWEPVPTVQWLRDGRAIAGATGRHYTPTRADRGHRVTAEVTFSRPGYLDRTRRAGRDIR